MPYIVHIVMDEAIETGNDVCPLKCSFVVFAIQLLLRGQTNVVSVRIVCLIP